MKKKTVQISKDFYELRIKSQGVNNNNRNWCTWKDSEMLSKGAGV